MPVYEFECKGCGHKFTLQESIDDHDHHREHCPKCQGKDIKQLISAAAVKTSKKS